MDNLPSQKLYSGQALLLVLLAMSVVVTVALSIVSRSITDVGVTSRQEDATRAFVAAETGVERALVAVDSTCTAGEPDCPEAGYVASRTDFAEGTRDINYPVSVGSGNSIPIWFINHNAAGAIACDATNPCFTGDRIKVCWGEVGIAPQPALEVAIYYANTPGNYATTRVAKAGYDANAASHENNFVAPDAGNCTITNSNGTKIYAYQKTIAFGPPPANLGATPPNLGIPATVYGSGNQGLLFAKLRLLYNTVDHPIGVTTTGLAGTSTFPGQGFEVNSTGTSGDANRRLKVFQSYSEPPAIFDSLIFSGTGVTK